MRRRAKRATGAGETVLVIEDDSAVRLIISDVLRDLGYACIEASDGQAALPMLTSNTPTRPADHRRRPARPERPADRRDRAPRTGRTSRSCSSPAMPSMRRGTRPFLEPGMEMVTKPFALDALALKIREMIHK